MISYGMVLRIRRTILGLSNTVRFYKIACYVSLHAFCRLWISWEKFDQKGYVHYKGQIWPPLEPKTESCFSPISSNLFIRRMAQV